MNKEFKTLIAAYLFEGKEFCPQFLASIDGWPKKQYKDQWNPPETYKLESTEISMVSNTTNSITVQFNDPRFGFHTVTIASMEGKLFVEECRVGGNEELEILGEEFRLLFKDVKISQRPQPKKSAAVWQMELSIALKNEDYAKAAEIRDLMAAKGINPGKTKG